MMSLLVVLTLSLLRASAAQQAGHTEQEGNPTIILKECTNAGGCTSQRKKSCWMPIGVGCIPQVGLTIVIQAILGTANFARIRDLCEELCLGGRLRSEV